MSRNSTAADCAEIHHVRFACHTETATFLLLCSGPAPFHSYIGKEKLKTTSAERQEKRQGREANNKKVLILISKDLEGQQR